MRLVAFCVWRCFFFLTNTHPGVLSGFGFLSATIWKKVQRSHFFPVMNLAWPRKSPGYGLQCWLVPSWLCLPSEDINVVGRQYDVLGWPRVSLVIKSLVMPLTALFWLSSRLAQSLENDKTKKKGHYHIFHRKIFFFVYERDKEINEQKKLQYSFFWQNICFLQNCTKIHKYNAPMTRNKETNWRRKIQTNIQTEKHCAYNSEETTDLFSEPPANQQSSPIFLSSSPSRLTWASFARGLEGGFFAGTGSKMTFARARRTGGKFVSFLEFELCVG